MASFEKNLTRISSNRDLEAYFISHFSKLERIGIEVELGIVDPETGISVSFETVESILEGIREQNVKRWSKITEEDRTVGLQGSAGSRISLEMGCAIEYSSRPYSQVSELVEVMRRDIANIAAVVEGKSKALVSVSLMPFNRRNDISWAPKKRGEIQKNYFEQFGENKQYGLNILSTILSTQVSFDYTSEQDLIEKTRALVAISPVLAALYVNSPLAENKSPGILSNRLLYWQRCDPYRCGCIPPALDQSFSIQKYVDWVLKIPLMFQIDESGTYVSVDAVPFSKVLKEGFPNGQKATMQDWSVHLSSILTDIRLKNVIEVRVMDAPPYDLIPSIPALLTGIVYHPPSIRAVESLFVNLTVQDYQMAMNDALNRGLNASYNGKPVKVLAQEILRIARRGLEYRIQSEIESKSILSFLQPIEEMVGCGLSAADMMIESWNGELNHSPKKFVEKYRISPSTSARPLMD